MTDDKNNQRPFRGKVKYENGKIVEEPIVEPLDDKVKAFIDETTDNSGIPIIGADGMLSTFRSTADSLLPTIAPSTPQAEQVQPAAPAGEIELPITSFQDWNAMLNKKASDKRINASKSKTAAFLQQLYNSEADGKATDDVAFSPKGDIVQGGWIEMPHDYPAWFINEVQTMTVMTTDVPIEFLSEEDLDKLVTPLGHVVFPIVLHVFTPTHYKGSRLYEYLNEQLAEEFAVTLDQEMVRGDGMGRPIGLFPRVSMLNEQGTMDEQGIAPPGVRSVRLVGVKPNEEAVLDIGMFFALDMELLEANGGEHLDNAKWYMNSNTALQLASMKDENGDYILDHEDIAMQMVGVPDKLAGHDIVYNEWMDDLYPGCTPIILGDLTGIYELKISPRFYIKRLADSVATDEQGAERQYAIGFYMAAGINLPPPDMIEAKPMPYVGIVIDGLVDKASELTEDEKKAMKAEFDVYLNGIQSGTGDIVSDAFNPTTDVDLVKEVPKEAGEERPDVVVTQVSNRNIDPAMQPTKPGEDIEDNSVTSENLDDSGK